MCNSRVNPPANVRSRTFSLASSQSEPRFGDINSPWFYLRLCALAAAIALGLLVAGFFRFQAVIDDYNNLGVLPADGIVVLTGGADRIETGIDLLEAGKAKRLLISGVHSQTSKNAMFNALGRESAKSPCCIDLGRKAANTVGNAREISEWAERHHFDRLIVVTSEYHMPRTLVELANANPDIKFNPYVARPRVLADKDEKLLLKTRLLEYGKFLAATARIWLLESNRLAATARM